MLHYSFNLQHNLNERDNLSSSSKWEETGTEKLLKVVKVTQ